ncbi:MAG TPA: hypothetical protein VIO32_02340 [Candidatus Baltobacteraceae bacterium]
MNRVLFVSNGHGEVAIAARLAMELQSLRPVACDHLALVGDFRYPSMMREVGPRRAMPSGGVIAMGNVRNIARDVRAGLLAHTLAQWRFLRSVRGTYALAVGVGDVFALLMALRARAHKTAFVGTAKSAYVAKYGVLERRVVHKADAVFVRDEATAGQLSAHGIAARAANAIVDLYAADASALDVPFEPLLAIFPGSRESAYDEAPFLCEVAAAVARREPQAGAVLSIAPGIDARRMSALFEERGWEIVRGAGENEPFTLRRDGREVVRAWRGPLGAMLARATIVLGQAGTANEAAAARGIPVVAFARSGERRAPWYRMRQIGLLGEAMIVAPRETDAAAAEVLSLLHDASRRERMGRAGRERMGAPGAAATIAAALAALVHGS